MGDFILPKLFPALLELQNSLFCRLSYNFGRNLHKFNYMHDKLDHQGLPFFCTSYICCVRKPSFTFPIFSLGKKYNENRVGCLFTIHCSCNWNDSFPGNPKRKRLLFFFFKKKKKKKKKK